MTSSEVQGFSSSQQSAVSEKEQIHFPGAGHVPTGNTFLSAAEQNHANTLPDLWGSVLRDDSNVFLSVSAMPDAVLPNLAENPLIKEIVTCCSELLGSSTPAPEAKKAIAGLEQARKLTETNIIDLGKKFQKTAGTALERQNHASCAIHSINNMFLRPGMVTASQALQMYDVMGEYGLALDESRLNPNGSTNSGLEKREEVLTRIRNILSEGNEDGAHRLISKIGGVEIGVLSTLLNSWVVPAANAEKIPVGKFQHKLFADLADTACVGKRMIAHTSNEPKHYFAVVPVLSKKKNAGNATAWEVRDSLPNKATKRFTDFNKLKKYLGERSVGNVLLES